MNVPSDKILLHLFIEGDDAAFSKIFRQYYTIMYNYGVKIIGSKAKTEDALQDFFVYLYQHRNKLGGVENLKPYLLVSFRRKLFREMKSQRLDLVHQLDEELLPFSVFSFEDLIIQKEIAQRRSAVLLKCLNQLSPRLREVLYLRYYCDLPPKEIAEVMQITYQSVLNKLQKAFRKLRELLQEDAILHEIKK